jgi:hypothetical protein
MKSKFLIVLYFCFIIELAFSQNDPNVYGNNPNFRWVLVNHSSNEVTVTFKNNEGFKLDPDGAYQWFSPVWLVNTMKYKAEANNTSGYLFVWTNFPAGKRYWSYNFHDADRVIQVWNGSIGIFYDKNNKLANSKLNRISLVRQAANSNYCGVACLQMVENYYFGRSNSLNNIWKEISNTSSMGRIVGRTYLMGKYAKNRNLSSSIVRFSDLSKVLYYCEAFQIPAIMNVRLSRDSSLGHYIVFAGYDPETGLVRVKDPNDVNTVAYNYRDLAYLFTKLRDSDEIGGNIIILPSDRMIIKKDVRCPNCNYINSVDELITDAITGLICMNCDRFLKIQ